MSRLFELDSVITHPQRNGFDLSQRHVFSTSLGMLQPVCCMEAIPGDKFKLSINSMVRTQTLNKAAFVRTNEYFDWFFVPTRLLWRYFPQFVMSIPNTESVSASWRDDTPKLMPYFKFEQFALLLAENDAQGYNLNFDACRLMDLLGYGNFFQYASQPVDPSAVLNDVDYNPFRLAAYQKIFNDFYRNTAWENSYAFSYNFDYIDSEWYNTEEVGLQTSVLRALTKLHYCSAKKDYFKGLKPNMQFGSVALAPVNSEYLNISSTGNPPSISAPVRVVSGGRLTAGTNDAPVTINGNLSILDLRRAEALQRWKEVTEANDMRYNAQVKAHFGVNVPDSRAQMSEFIGGIVNPISITEVVATSAGSADGSGEGSTVLGQVGGKGLGISDGSKTFEYEAKEHGIVMCIHHIAPEIDYDSVGIDKYNTKLDKEDFFTPEYDRISLAPIRRFEHEYNPTLANVDYSQILGYAPRWLDYKTGIDKVHFDFIAGGSLSSWVGHQYRFSSTVNYTDFEIRPSYYNSIFAVAYNGEPSTDQFLCNSYFSIGSVRNMSVDSMPY